MSVVDSGDPVIRDDRDELAAEVKRLRAELAASRAVSARALARSTRLAQLVSALGKVTDVTAILESAVSEVAELFDADITAVLTPPVNGGDGASLAAQWGISGRNRPPDVFARPADTGRLTAVRPVVAGPVGDLCVPDWLESSRPKHIAWGLLTVRDEHLGHLLLVRRGAKPFEAADVQELTAVVSRISLAVDNGRLYRRTQEQLLRLQRLNEVTAGLAGMVDVSRAAQNIVETLVAHVPVAGAALYLAGADGRRLMATAGPAGDWPQHLTSGHVQVPGLVALNLGADGASIGTLLLSGAPVPGTDARSFLEHLADVGGLVLEKATLFERVRNQAETDALTGLPNRSSMLDRLSSELDRCRQEGSDLAVIFVDLDGFKAVNDTYGHDAGDQLLVVAARRLNAVAGPTGIAARLGGDEFVIACPDVTPEEGRLLIADEIQQAMDTPYLLHLRSGAVEVKAGGSIGVSMAGEHRYDLPLLLSNADAAMYAAKQSRRAGAAARS